MKKPFIFILSLLLAVLMFQAAHAANTVTVNVPTISIVPDGSTNLDVQNITGVPTAIPLTMIVFHPSAANDYIQVRNGSASGAIIWPANADVLGAGQVLYYDGLLVDPYIVASECNFGTAANAKITIIYNPSKAIH